jgi:MoaA/NifB/PqqE/SkfB family radical SAM enzyme
LRKIKVLHLESTDVCQLACPLCARETDLNFNKRLQHHLNIPHVQQHFSNKEIASLEKMFMCGNYGDPAAGKHTLDIYRWVRTLNPNITLGMNSNGALQNTFWWHELGKILNQTCDYVVFSIDGLEDTNPVYRVNTNWEKLMSNVEAFISAGGSAHWDMLVYKHNQHQVDACEQLARDMGFKWFRAKVSKRPLTNRLESPIGWQPAVVAPGKIKCHAMAEKSAYINAQGRLSPCCWLSEKDSILEENFKNIKLSWKTDTPNTICKATCSTNTTKTSFTNQWQREICLN